ncbi:MAG: TusE/DsrC/DsvC family sulfur relay protein [Gemmatimonadaceae bacterium]
MPNLMMVGEDASEVLAQPQEALGDKLDRILVAIEQLDARRQELEDLAADLMPSANAALRIAMERLDRLEKSGVLAFATASLDALEHVAQTVDPRDVHALAERAGNGLRIAHALTAPEVTVIADRAAAALANVRRGKAPSLWRLLKARKEPRVRRGAAALLEILRAIGDGASPAPDGPPHVRPQVARRPAVAARAPAAAACPAPTASESRRLRQLAGATVGVDAEGFLTDHTQWTREIAEQLAAESGLAPLTDRHWQIIAFCRKDAADTGAAPGMRRITQVLGIAPKEMYALFPKGPGILAARIAGLSKPKSCV